MKSDNRGQVDCPSGEERHEFYHSGITNRNMIQYDYRTPAGELFSCITYNLEDARKRRDRWLRERGA